MRQTGTIPKGDMYTGIESNWFGKNAQHRSDTRSHQKEKACGTPPAAHCPINYQIRVTTPAIAIVFAL